MGALGDWEVNANLPPIQHCAKVEVGKQLVCGIEAKFFYVEKKHLCQSASSLQQSHRQCSQRWEKQNPATKGFDQKLGGSVKRFVSPGRIFHPGQPCTSQEVQTSQTPSPSPFINSIFTLGSFLDLGFSQGGGWSNEGWWWTFLSHDERRLAITIQLGLVKLKALTFQYMALTLKIQHSALTLY